MTSWKSGAFLMRYILHKGDLIDPLSASFSRSILNAQLISHAFLVVFLVFFVFLKAKEIKALTFVISKIQKIFVEPFIQVIMFLGRKEAS